MELKKPLVVARKPGKLPGQLYEKNYSLEYGNSSLSIQKDAINLCDRFVIVDDLLATGGTIKCVEEILKNAGKKIEGISVVIELNDLKAKDRFSIPVYSELIF